MKEKGEHLVASKWRRDDCHRKRKSLEDNAWKESQGVEEEDKRTWCTACESAARKMLKHLEDNEHVKVGLSELKEQLEMPEEAGTSFMQIANRQGMREAKLFQIFMQEENEVHIASLARWGTQLKGSVELERRCQDLMQEVNLLGERQEVLAGLVEDKS